MKKIPYMLSLIPFFLSLQGCSPHPGAGHWAAIESTGSRFSRITVEFEGRGELLPADTAAETQRCFWSGRNANAIQLQCTQGDDSGLEFLYVFTVDSGGDEPVATLTQGDKPIGDYRRQPR